MERKKAESRFVLEANGKPYTRLNAAFVWTIFSLQYIVKGHNIHRGIF
jgi:hypothetical protein